MKRRIMMMSLLFKMKDIKFKRIDYCMDVRIVENVSRKSSVEMNMSVRDTQKEAH
jgi:histidinol phosphatase-like enzyme